MYGTTWCQDGKRAKRFFGEHHIAYESVDVDQDRRAAARRADQRGQADHPRIVFPDGPVLVEPSNAELAAKLGLQTRPDCRSTTLSLSAVGRPA
jgi:mycoredoxin